MRQTLKNVVLGDGKNIVRGNLVKKSNCASSHMLISFSIVILLLCLLPFLLHVVDEFTLIPQGHNNLQVHFLRFCAIVYLLVLYFTILVQCLHCGCTKAPLIDRLNHADDFKLVGSVRPWSLSSDANVQEVLTHITRLNYVLKFHGQIRQQGSR